METGLVTCEVHGYDYYADGACLPCTRDNGAKPAMKAKPAPFTEHDLPAVEDLAGLLDEIVAFVRRFMFVSDHQAHAIALFAAHTHGVDAFDVVAYLFVTSATKRSGKTLLLDLLEHLCMRGRSTANISPAALYRMVEELHPTLMFDEVDNIFTKGNNRDPGKTDLAGLINAGYRRGRPAYRMGGANMRTLESFDPFGPKVLAGIGGCLPDTTEDRCIKARLKRKPRSAIVERYRIRLHDHLAKTLGDRLSATVGAMTDRLREAWPNLPNELDDRAQDIWEPLLAIADAGGAEWPTRARAAAVALHTDADPIEDIGVELLGDIRVVFDGHDKMFSATIVERLNAIDETPWAGWHRGEGFATRDLARLLRGFDIRSKQIRIGAASKRGYLIDDFADAWETYPASRSETSETSETPLASPVSDVSDVADGGAA